MTGSWQPFAPHRAISVARRLRSLIADGKGVLMLETIVGVTVLSVLATAALIGLSATQRARGNIDRQAIAENLARNQMEYVFSQTYQTASTDYSAVTSFPDGYSVASTQELVDGDSDLQKITTTIIKGGRTLISLETYRANEALRNESQ